MPALDIFSGSAFSMVALTDAINKMPYVPGRIGQLGLFREQGVSTTSVMIEEREGSLNLVETTARGAPAIQNTTNKRKARSLVGAAHRARGHDPRRRGAERARLRLREHARGRPGGGEPAHVRDGDQDGRHAGAPPDRRDQGPDPRCRRQRGDLRPVHRVRGHRLHRDRLRPRQRQPGCRARSRRSATTSGARSRTSWARRPTTTSTRSAAPTSSTT